ncbi:16S rRNA (cytidine(1402)-2'-O)-methyltransferase [Euzebya tangerina]|uniref:16S rRNA (cytidine(1402)-2'-O)-methyltransferase n=1 Tax=Euzebya tangerina TaxID=591198 RepID=UPI000E30D601|nr:16S rRNA (cytidine(1402)-2'-O)-methyltransferase [Euzebya tangerina]
MSPAAETDHGQLVVVATPIGNLDDLSPRAAAMLASADLIGCEDTRRTGQLLAHLGVRTPMRAVHDHNESAVAGELCDLVAAGQTIALVSDAGTPGISDPGHDVVREAARRGLTVTAIPGPAAVIHALTISGLPTDRFAFEGFLPRKQGARLSRLQAVARDDRTLVFYVSPHRAADDLAAMVEAFGPERPAALTRELTKLYEEVTRGTLARLAEEAVTNPPRGEVTLVVGPAPPTDPSEEMTDQEVRDRVQALVERGASRRDAVRQVADETGRRKREVYDLAT